MANQWLERELEDYLAEDPYLLYSSYMPVDKERFEVGLLGRQIKCRYGIIDLLIYTNSLVTGIPIYTVTVVELKAVKADHKTVEQVMRYMSAIEQVGFYDAVPDNEFFDYGHYIEDFVHFESTIVAPSFDDSITWFPNKIIATKSDDGFELSAHGGIKGASDDNHQLHAALSPLFPRVAASARQRHMSDRLRSGMNRPTHKIGTN